MRHKYLLHAALLVMAFDCGGCAAKTAAAKDDDQYVTLPPATGSFLPRRVKKSDLNKTDTSTGVVSVSGDALSQSYLMTPKASASAAAGGK